MWLRTLRLESFRNYERLELTFERGLNFLHGPNGAGKTSILEAVSYLAVARSLRGAGDAEVARWGGAGFGVAGEVVDGEGARTLVLRYSRGGSKEATIDGEPAARLADLVGHLRVAWFSPEDTWITKGGPDARRRLLDMTLCQVDPVYLAALTSYKRVLRQRNEALLSWAPDEDSDRVLAAWTDRLVEYGSAVIAGRERLLPGLEHAASAFHAAIAGGEPLSLGYRSSVPIEGGERGSEATDERRAAIAERFSEALGSSAEDERRRGFTLLGPHRDDLDVRLGGKSLRSFGSQGQHRTAAVALKLGQAAVLDHDGRGIVVLLDDVLSELDEERGRALVRHIGEHGQALVTSTRPGPQVAGVDALGASFVVDGGEVERE